MNVELSFLKKLTDRELSELELSLASQEYKQANKLVESEFGTEQYAIERDKHNEISYKLAKVQLHMRYRKWKLNK